MLETVGSFLRDLVPGLRPRVGDKAPEIEKGMSFARIIAADVTEIARVLEVTKNAAGVPHIRFALEVRDQTGLHDEGTRVLAVPSFVAQYKRLK